MQFFKNGSSFRFMILLSVMLFLSVVFYYSVNAGFFSTVKGDVELVEMDDETDPDYEGYEILDMDDDLYITEDDFYQKLEEINQQVAAASSSIAYIRTIYGADFTLTPLTVNTAIQYSANHEEYRAQLSIARQQLEQLTAENNAILNAIGDLDWHDAEIARIKQELAAIGDNIFLANWYVGAR